MRMNVSIVLMIVINAIIIVREWLGMGYLSLCEDKEVVGLMGALEGKELYRRRE